MPAPTLGRLDWQPALDHPELLAAPVAAAVVWNVYENAAHLLPNLL